MRARPSSKCNCAWQRSSILPGSYMLPDRCNPDVRPNPRILRRAVDEWLPLSQASLIGRVVRLQHGGQQRPVIHRGSKHGRFRFHSTKTQSTQLGEGRGEEALAYFNEVSASVIDYECHPFEFHFRVRNRMVRYRVDAVRFLRTGAIEVIEVKRFDKDLSDPERREVLALAKELCREIGWLFTTKFENQDELAETKARVLNIAGLLDRCSMTFTREQEHIAGRVVGRGETILWGELRERLAPNDPLYGDALIEGFAAKGLFSFDFDQRPTPRTVLTPHRPYTGPSPIRL